MGRRGAMGIQPDGAVVPFDWLVARGGVHMVEFRPFGPKMPRTTVHSGRSLLADAMGESSLKTASETASATARRGIDNQTAPQMPWFRGPSAGDTAQQTEHGRVTPVTFRERTSPFMAVFLHEVDQGLRPG